MVKLLRLVSNHVEISLPALFCRLNADHYAWESSFSLIGEQLTWPARAVPSGGGGAVPQIPPRFSGLNPSFSIFINGNIVGCLH